VNSIHNEYAALPESGIIHDEAATDTRRISGLLTARLR
jgi:hypothetical protein